MSLQNGFLAILTHGAAYGSQLQSEFLARAAHRRQLNAGQVYSTLDRMTAHGLVERAGLTADQLPRYALTADGHAAAQRWLTTGPRGAEPEWNEMQDQVLIAASIAGADVRTIIHDYRLAYAERIHGLSDAGSHARIAANRARELAATAAIEWLDTMRTALTTNPAMLIQPRSSERPRRGRRPGPR